MKSSIFRREEELLNITKELLKKNNLSEDNIVSFISGYEKLLKQTKRLVKMSDRTEAELNELSKEQVRLNKILSTQNNELETLSSKLSKYLSPQVYDSIFSGKSDVKIRADRKYLTVFFSDIVSFTEISDQLEPEILTKSLNVYLNEMAMIAISSGATIDKYIGDAIMAFFGDPETLGIKGDAKRCVEMAIEMQKKAEILRNSLKEIGVTRPFNIRCGINSGMCTVGNFGSENRLDYTAIGNQVNLASRLESNANSGEILVSEETMNLTQDKFRFRPNKEIKVKGFARPINTFTVLGKIQDGEDNILKFSVNGINLELNKQKINKDSLMKIKEIIQDIQNKF